MSDYSDEDYFDEDEDMIQDEDEYGSASSEEDMDIDAYNEDVKTAVQGHHKSYEVDHTSLSQQAVEKMMQEEVDSISNIFSVDPNKASLLLRNMGWNVERLTERYMENADAVSAAAGIGPSSSHSASAALSTGPIRRTPRRTGTDTSTSSTGPLSRATPLPRSRASTPAAFVCPICFDDSRTDTRALACGHAFCAGCWTDYVTSKVRTEGEYVIRCMAEGCALVAPDAFIGAALSGDKESERRFEELLARDFVGARKNLKFCPYPSCTYTVSCPAASTKASLATIVPTVSCGGNVKHVFCFGCDVDGDHRPCVCAVAKLWLKKCADDSETANWIKSNTKECTKCQSTIEKNGGCNHMTCKKCKHEFCWVCMGPWSEHGTSWYSCNRYDEKAGVDARDAQSKSRASLERYLHYYNRWANHEQSAKLSLELYAKTEKKMEEMQVSSALTWIEVQFMRKAVDEVFKCRMTLKWTYAMAYYLEKGNQKELFEDNQRDLERAVEDLSELLEGPLDPEHIVALRQKVTDRTVYVQKRNEIMLEDTATGLQEGRWRWNVTVDGFDDPE